MYFVRRSTTTKITEYLLDDGRDSMKSIDIFDQLFVGWVRVEVGQQGGYFHTRIFGMWGTL